jgi:hypothetical protein
MIGDTAMSYCRRGLLLGTIFLLLSSCAVTSGKGNDPEVKFHPGHYAAIGPLSELSEINFLDEPAIQGVNKRYFWRTIEPDKGAYDFKPIADDLEYLGGLGKRLVVFLMDKSFSEKSALPGYLSNYEFTSDWGGFSPVRWHPFYIERLLALGDALGDRFDSNPYFEGIAIQESSIGITEAGYKEFGYTPEKYRDALIASLLGLQSSLPKSHVFWYSNFLPGNSGYLRRIADAIEDTGVFMGGPDILPHRQGLLQVSYPMYEEYKHTITLFCSAQGDSYKHHRNDIDVDQQEPTPEEGFLTMEDIFLFARDSLHVRYIFWDYEYDITEPGQRTFDDAIAVIRKYPAFNQ